MSALATRSVGLSGPRGKHTYALPHAPKRFVVIEYYEQAVLLGEKIFNDTVKFVAYDVETAIPENKNWNALHRMAKAFGASFSIGNGETPDHTFWYRFGGANEDLDEYMLEVIKHIFSGEHTFGVLMHNAAFDINRTRNTFDIAWTNPRLNDTWIMAAIMNKFVNNKLKTLGHILLRENADWENLRDLWFRNNKIKVKERCFSMVPEQIMGPYAMTDTELTYRIFFKLKEHLAAERQALVELYKLEREILPAIADLEWRGMRIDDQYLQIQMQKIGEQLNNFVNHFHLIWGDISLKSPKDLIPALYGTDESRGQLGLPVTIRTLKTKQPSIKAAVLETYIADNPMIEDFVKYQRLSRALTTMQSLMFKSVDTDVGRVIHTSYNQVLSSGRVSTSPNLQNFINDDRGKYKKILRDGSDVSVRKAFIPPEDYMYVKMDYAAFELRLIANASGDKKLQQMILDGVDMHSWLAVRLYYNELTQLNADNDGLYERTYTHHDALTEKWDLDWRYYAVTSRADAELKRMRNVVKICSFSIVYGVGPKKLSREFNVTIEEANNLKRVWFTNFRVVASWRKRVIEETERTRRVYSMFGRIRRIKEREYVGTIAVNHVIQGTAADILKYTLRDMFKILKGKKSYMCSNIHDEIQFYIHKDEFDIVPALIECMEIDRLPRDQFPIPMTAELSASPQGWWYCKDVPHDNDCVQRLTELWNQNSSDNLALTV